MSRDVGLCAFEDCERPLKPNAQICSECADGKEPSEYAALESPAYSDVLINGCVGPQPGHFVSQGDADKVVVK